jgi:aromatic ring-opening dioxygenase catalytic subunit (LigB family)
MMNAAPDAAPPAQRAAFFEGWAGLRARVAARRPDVVVIVSNEHFTNFFLDVFPATCIGLGDHHEGPVEPWLGIAPGRIPGHPGLARHLLDRCVFNGHEPAFSHRLKLDHGIITVHRQLDPSGRLPLVPVVQNCAVAPMPTLRRCYEFGLSLAEAIRSWRGDDRVVLMGAGGLSHSVGTPHVGEIDEEFDRWFLGCLERGDIESVLDVPDDELEQAGNGAHEIRSWLTAAGAAVPALGRTVVYEPIQPWITGMGVMEWDLEPPAATMAG